ncbi:MAG: amidohydrolase family protein [Candidatus Kapaibacteriales bacterium]
MQRCKVNNIDREQGQTLIEFKGKKIPKIDMHTHIMPEHMPDFKAKFGYGNFIMLDHHKPGAAWMMQGGNRFRQIYSNCWDPNAIVEDRAKFGIDLSVICTIPVLFSYWAEPKDGLEVSRFLNDDIAKTVADHHKDFVALGTVPMQDTTLAIQELERCVNELSLPGLQIGSHIGSKNLSDPELFPFFEAAADLGASIFVHPWDMMGMDRMRRYWLPWLVGMPAEVSLAICSLIFGGVMERLPNLKLCFAHAGGSFPATIGRIEHGFNVRPDLVAIDNDINPKEYINKFWLDSITHDADALRFVRSIFDDDKLCLGSDYPFPLGELHPGKMIETEMPELEIETVEQIFYKSTCDWLGIDMDDYL